MASLCFVFQHRRKIRKLAASRYLNRQDARQNLDKRREERVIPQDEIEDVFHTVTQADINAAKRKEKS